jgi:hypothetical protein
MRAKRRLVEQVDDEEEAIEARDWHEEWVALVQQDETTSNQRSQE